MKFLLTLFGFLLCFAAANAQTNGSFVHNSATRTFITYVPSTYNRATPTPLVLVLHGLTMSGSSIMSVTGFNTLAETNHFIAVYPDGLNNDWNFGGTGASSTDDVGFLNALIDTINSHYNIASNKLFSCGFSAGGFMSYRMACESGRCFAAIASVSGTMGTSVFTSCTPSHKCSILQIHGTSDFIVPYTGAMNNESVDNVIQKWISFDNCPTTPNVTNLPDKTISDLSTVTTYQYTPGNNNTEVLLYKVIGGGHQWPGTSSILGGLGTINMDINASEEIAHFFARHSCADFNGLNHIENSNPNWTIREIEQNIFSIEGEDKIEQISVYTVNGQEIITALANQHYMDLSALPQGVYFLNVKGSNKIQSLRIVL
jgi:polyhydroxybutyrate depolymerase